MLSAPEKGQPLLSLPPPPVNCFRGNVAVDSANCQTSTREGARLLDKWVLFFCVHRIVAGKRADLNCCYLQVLVEMYILNVPVFLLQNETFSFYILNCTVSRGISLHAGVWIVVSFRVCQTRWPPLCVINNPFATVTFTFLWRFVQKVAVLSQLDADQASFTSALFMNKNLNLTTRNKNSLFWFVEFEKLQIYYNI